jgi:hypothetical protein
MRLSARACLAVAFAFLEGCAADSTGPQHVSLNSAASYQQNGSESGAELVARAIALGMKAPAVRLAVRDALRASPLTEHKLVLQDFVTTPTGRALLTEAATRMRIAVDSLDRIIGQLPALDFYVPSDAQRRTWRGEGTGVRVAFAQRERGPSFSAYDVDGNAGDAITALKQTSGATLVLQNAQRKSRRIHPQASVPGTVIQDPDDGELSGSFVQYLPDGSIKVTELADYFAGKPGPSAPAHETNITGTYLLRNPWSNTVLPPPPCDVCGGGNIQGPRDTTFLQYLVVISVCDDWSCLFGHNEFEWHTYYSNNNGSTWTDRFDLRIEGVPSDAERTVHVPALFRKVRYSYERIQSDVVETDTWGDDHFTPSPQWTYTEAGKLKSEGASRCGYPKYYGGYYDCYDPYLPFPWREVNQSMAWTPY